MEIIHVSENENYNRGITLFDHGLYAEAIAEFERALKTVSRDDAPERKLAPFYMCEAYTNLGLDHLRMKMYHRAEEELKLALVIHPEYADLHFYLGVVHYRQEQYEEAEKRLQAALAINPTYAKALMYRGLTRLRRDSEEGLASVAEAVRMEPAYNDERHQQALSLYRDGSVEQALVLMEEVAELDVDQIRYLLDKGRQLMKQKDYLEASNALLEAVSICPRYADLRHYLGLCYMRQGIIDLAIGQFGKALESNPGFVTARVSLALAYEKDDKADLAVRELEHVLRLDPENHVASRILSKLQEGE